MSNTPSKTEYESEAEEAACGIGYLYGLIVKADVVANYTKKDHPRLIKMVYGNHASGDLDTHRRIFGNFTEKARFKAFRQGFGEALAHEDNEDETKDVKNET